MKVAVVFDSVHGNTKQAAEAMAEQIRADGHSVETLNLREQEPRRIEADLMFVGGPTRMKKMTRPVKAFVKRLDRAHWSTKPIVVFDTYGPLGKTEEEKRKAAKWLVPGAVGTIMALGQKMGLKMHPTTLRLAVTDLKGPLEPGSLDRAKAFVHEIVTGAAKQ